MEKLIQEIKDHFATGTFGIRILSCLDKWKTYTLRQSGEYGLAIEYNSKEDLYEEANEVILYTTFLTTESETKKYLVLACCDEKYRNNFAELSYDFANPGINGRDRQNLLSDPLAWWNQWIGLLGDKMRNRKSYDIIAELLALDFLYQKDKTVVWKAAEAGTHDIESATESFEVKSTIKKSETCITISSQHQLESSNKLSLLFFRMEKSLSGFSINDILKSLVAHGYDESLLESQLEKKGYKRGSSIRDVKYTILEIRMFDVDDKFPKIVETSFKDDVFPKNIIKILYTIDLEGLNYTSILFNPQSDVTLGLSYSEALPGHMSKKYESFDDCGYLIAADPLD